MKKLLLILLLFNSAFGQGFFPGGRRVANAAADSSGAANNYYVTSGGDNDHDGTSPATAWQTFSYALSHIPGYKILNARRGVAFHEAVSIPSNITIQQYGSGSDSATIDGSILLSSPTSIGSNLYEYSCPTCGDVVNMVTVNGVDQQMGRTPNTGTTNGGYIGLEYQRGDTLLQSYGITRSWIGAELVAKVYFYVLNRLTVINQRNDSVIVDPAGAGIYSAGFFFQNDSLSSNLDLDKEWYYSPTRKVLRIKLDNDPSTYSIRIATIDTLITISSKSNITINGIRITGANKIGTYLYSSSGVVFSHIKSDFHGLDAFHGNAVHDDTIKYCRIENVNNNGIFFPSPYNCDIEKDTLTNIGILDGMGQGSLATVAIWLEKLSGGSLSHHNTVDSNIIHKCGWIGIRYSGHHNNIRYNDIDSCGLIKADGAAIYTWAAWAPVDSNYNNLVAYNYLHDNIGNSWGTSFGGVNAVFPGIYCDDASNGSTITGNIVTRNTHGILWHNVQRMTSNYNVLYDNGNGSLDLVMGGGQKSVGWDDIIGIKSIGLSVIGNKLISKDSSQYSFSLGANNRSGYDYDFGTFDSNKVLSPVRAGHSKVLQTIQSDNNNLHTFYSASGWNTLFGRTLHTLENPSEWFDYSIYSVPDFFSLNVNNTFSAINPSLIGTWKDLDNGSRSGSITVQPFTALPLVKTSSITDTYAPERWNGLPAIGISGYVNDDVVLSLTTNENCTCKYSTSDVAYGSMSNTFDGGGTKLHSKSITRPADGTYNIYYVRCTDGTNINTDSYPISFRVGGAAYDIVVTNLSTTSVKITWTTLENSDSRVDYGTTTGYGSNSFNGGLTTAHSLTITGLTSGTLYHYKLTDFDTVSTIVSSDFTFTTL